MQREEETVDCETETIDSENNNLQPIIEPIIETMSAETVTETTIVAPKLGGLIKNASRTTIVWFGGAPNTTFTGTAVHIPTPLCFRSVDDYSTAMKTYNARTVNSSELKFKHNDPDYSFDAFGEDMKRHMTRHGMDTVFYMKGASGPRSDDGENVFVGETRIFRHSKPTTDRPNMWENHLSHSKSPLSSLLLNTLMH